MDEPVPQAGRQAVRRQEVESVAEPGPELGRNARAVTEDDSKIAGFEEAGSLSGPVRIGRLRGERLAAAQDTAAEDAARDPTRVCLEPDLNPLLSLRQLRWD